jgi:hypothetical protein
MKVKLSLMLLVVALVSVPAYAQTGVAGKWVGELSAADGHGVAQAITVDLKVEGETLSGTVAEGALEPRPIAGASMEGTTVTFRTTRNLGGSDINVNWKGELKGEDLSLTREIGPAPAEAGGGRGGRGGGGAPAAGGRGGRGGAAPAAGGQRGGAPAAAAPATAAPATAAPVPPVPAPQAGDTPDANAAAAPAAAGGRGGGQRGGARGGAAPAAAGGAAAPGGRGAAAPTPGPTVTLTLHRSR